MLLMNTSRTTINLPTDLLEAAKEAAFYRKTTLTALIRKGITKEIGQKAKKSKKNSLSSFVGGRSLGFKGIKREEIYDEYLRKKVSI